MVRFNWKIPITCFLLTSLLMYSLANAAEKSMFALTLSTGIRYEMPRDGEGINDAGHGNGAFFTQGSFYIFLKSHNYTRFSGSIDYWATNEFSASAGMDMGRMYRGFSSFHPYVGIGSNITWRKDIGSGTRDYYVCVPVFIGIKLPRYPYFSGIELSILTELYGRPSQISCSVDISNWLTMRR
ncbi:MAG: hypothetical protein JW768_10985 [Chitinispirillaceae bacterium]|nr:hypothetical protein [Chitinispirillaceae bacterium]